MIYTRDTPRTAQAMAMFKQEVYGGLASTRAVDTNIIDKDIVVLVGKNSASNFKESKKINQFLPIYMCGDATTERSHH